MSNQQIIRLISEGKTDHAISTLLDYFKDKDDAKYRKIAQISSRYKNLISKNENGIISDQRYTLELNKISYSLLSSLNPKRSFLNITNDTMFSGGWLTSSNLVMSAGIVFLVMIGTYIYANKLSKLKNKLNDLNQVEVTILPENESANFRINNPYDNVDCNQLSLYKRALQDKEEQCQIDCETLVSDFTNLWSRIGEDCEDDLKDEIRKFERLSGMY